MSWPWGPVMHISERELTNLTRDMDDMHHAARPAMRAAVAEWATTRRTFLIGGATAATGVLAACSSTTKPSSSPVPSFSVPAGPGQGLTGDLAFAALAAALENTAVLTYQKGIAAAAAGKLGAVPSAVVAFAQTAQVQHRDHAVGWNAFLTGSGKAAIPPTYGDSTVYAGVVAPALGSVTDVTGLANLALSLETMAAATYLAGIDAATVPAAVKIAMTIQPVEMQHAAILSFILGKNPVPDTFARTDTARTGTDQIGVLG